VWVEIESDNIIRITKPHIVQYNMDLFGSCAAVVRVQVKLRVISILLTFPCAQRYPIFALIYETGYRSLLVGRDLEPAARIPLVRKGGVFILIHVSITITMGRFR